MDNQAYTDEINLFDYLKIIYKWKFLIIALCVISIAVTFIITSRPAPTTYKVTALVSPGALSYTPEGKEIPIDSAANIQSLIQNSALNSKIIEKLKLDPAQYSGMQFTTQLPKDSDVIRIFYDTPDPEKGKVIMNELMNQLSDSYKNRLVLNRETVSKQIDKLKNTLTLQQNKKERLQDQKYRLQNQKERLQTQREELQNEKERLQNKKERKLNEKKRLESNSKLLSNKLDLLTVSENNLHNRLKKAEEALNSLYIEKDDLLKKSDKADTQAIIFYSNIIQNAIGRLDNLRSSIENKSIEQASIKNELSKNEILSNDLDTEVKDIATQMQDMAVKMKNLDIGAKDIDSQIKDFITQEKDLDIETLTPLKEIESITKLGATGTENIKILQQPNASINTVEMRRGKKVAAAGITALFLGIMLAFFIEYINKMQRAAR